MRVHVPHIVIMVFSVFLFSACGPRPIATIDGHLEEPPASSVGDIPRPVRQPVVLPPPTPTPKTELYSVVVNDVPVRDLLFSLARDAQLNVDIHPDINGRVTMNAIEQTLPQILQRISNQVDMRYALDGPNLVLLPDRPYLKAYTVDYVNISRNMTSSVSVADQVSTVAQGTNSEGNNSRTRIESASNNQFWQTLEQNIREILGVAEATESTGAPAGAGQTVSAAPAPPAGGTSAAPGAGVAAAEPGAGTAPLGPAVIVNRENGIVYVRASSRQHESIQEFLSGIMQVARRQVLIEATVVEVQLSDGYQQGIDWQILRNTARGLNMSFTPQGTQPLPTGATPGGSYPSPVLADGNPIFGSGSPAAMLVNFTDPQSFWNFSAAATISLLESFGKVKVLSSPRISVLNNQTALLKVVDNKVYFTVDVDITAATATSPRTVTYTTEVHTVPEGFVMSVTPQIDADDTVTLSVRPSITRVIGYVRDPNPALAEVNVTSLVPEIQTREMESILKIHNAELAVMGGLMQDRMDHKSDGTPVMSSIPLIGDLFRYRNETNSKSELVVFLKPVVIKDARLDGDYRRYRHYVPDERFFGPKKQPFHGGLFDSKADSGGKP